MHPLLVCLRPASHQQLMAPHATPVGRRSLWLGAVGLGSARPRRAPLQRAPLNCRQLLLIRLALLPHLLLLQTLLLLMPFFLGADPLPEDLQFALRF